MEAQPTEWRLRALCPDCQQGSLLLIACPGCEHVAVVCEECGATFADAGAVSTTAQRKSDARCTQCGEYPLALFGLATSAQLLASGLTFDDYA